MMSQGARNYLFIGRSGTEKPAAKSLIRDLELAGANVKVIQGDICNAEVTALAVKAANTSIGGVIQAAMNLKVEFQHHNGYSSCLTNYDSGITVF